jgi:long-chain acyl-CoA synthetase
VNLMMLLEMARSAFPGRIALTSAAASYTFEELFRSAGAAAQLVSESAVERLAILDVTSPAVPIGLFASAWAGVPLVPLNYRLTGDELDALLERVAPALLVTDEDRARRFGGREGIRAVSREDFLARAASFETSLSEGEWPMEPDDIAILLFTSGTTGAPKAAVLRQRHLVSYILGSVEFGSAEASDAALVSVPPYHIAGMAAVLSSIYAGRRIVQLPSFDPGEWVALVNRERVTHAFVVPTMLSRIVDAIDREPVKLETLRALSYGGGKMPTAVIERALKAFPDSSFTNAYGLTETSSTISLLGPDEHRAAAASDDEAARRRLSSVGKPLPGVEVEIRGPGGAVLGPGERGEIHVRGEQVSGEYLERGSRLTDDGFFPTRDAGILDEEGYLFLDGRIDDVIVRGGENLSPGEIEEVLLEHAAVCDAAVVGLPDEQWGEAVAAAVVLRAGTRTPGEELRAELRAWVKDRLRSTRVPQWIVFRDDLPYNETGKLLRRAIRTELVHEIGVVAGPAGA